MSRPLIAVTPLMDYGRDSLWMVPGYMDAVERAGGLPVILPLSTDSALLHQAAQDFDGFLFTGGPDVGSWVQPIVTKRGTLRALKDIAADYTQALSDAAASKDQDATRHEVLSPERDAMEAQLLAEVMRLDKPMLGICRGIQFMNVALGGTLWHDLPSEHPSHVEHHMKPPYDAYAHTVSLVPGSPLSQALDEDERLGVNSYHHQAVKDVAPGLEVMATAVDDVVEALWRPKSRFLWAVQWHPEFMAANDDDAQGIFNAFVSAVAHPSQQ